MTPRWEPYLSIRDLLVYRKGNHEVVLVLQAYFDESGDEDKPFICMGGCLADGKAWDKFEIEWRKVLTEFNVTELHMAQLMSHPPQEKYKGWGDEKREKFLARLMPIILDTVNLFIGTSESMEQHNLHPHPKDDPYFHCLLTCIDCAASYADKSGPNEKVEMVFADHPEHSKRVRILYPEVKAVSGFYDHLGPDTYGSPKDILPLQAADMAGFLYRKETERRHHGSRWEMHPLLEQLKDRPWCNRGYFSFDHWPRIEPPSE
jgi:hypothetical protein